MAKIIKHNITYNSAPSTATLLPYDNRDSGLSATTTKGAIDELADEKADKTEVPNDLQDLNNVSISSATNGQILKYDGTNWINANGGTGSSSFADLTDVSLNNVQNGQVPKYNSTTGKWENANESGGGSIVTVTQIQSTGNKIATIGVDGVNTDLYSPSGVSSVSVTQVQSTGTKIGTINVDGNATDLYAPNGGGGASTTFLVTASHPNNPTVYSVVVKVGTTTVFSKDYSCTIYGVFSETTDTFTYDGITFTVVAQGYKANSSGEKMLDFAINSASRSVNCSASNSSYATTDTFTLIVTGGVLASYVSYDNTTSGLVATDVQDAIDEVVTDLGSKADASDVPEDIQDLDNVTITSATSGQILKYDGSGWVNANESTGSTVSVTQIQSTGTKIATISVDSVDTDLYAPNGGGGASALNDLSDVTITSATNGQVLKYNGSGWVNATESGGGSGHTILDNEGDSLTQRTNLQFKGAYSYDNSTDDTTEVNVVREMTKAEFDLLSADEKVGFINITDITGGNDDRFQPVVYSEEEREIGVWTDGKPLYQRTVKIDALQSSASLVDYPHGISDIDTICESWGYIHWTSGTIAPLNTMQFSGSSSSGISVGASFFYLVGTTNVSIQTGMDRHTSSATVTIRYTKTTDTAGSGTWTPQGVPAKHYSTVEHVIGTWADGSPLYERSYAISHSSFTTGWKWFSLGVVCDKLVDAEVELKDSQGTYCYTGIPVAVQYSDGAIGIYNGMGGTMGNVSGYVTIRYTKSS